MRQLARKTIVLSTLRFVALSVIRPEVLKYSQFFMLLMR